VTTTNAFFVYESFGFILDRRANCPNQVSGGAWEIDPSDGRLLGQIAPELHFATLIPDGVDPALYGLASGGPNWEFPVQIVRMDVRDGQILKSRTLDTDRWHISIATFRMAPTGDVRVTQDHPLSVK
jgi:hypothetical protein